MKILHLIYDDLANPWVGGGGAIRTLEINKRIAAAGHVVVVTCGRYPGSGKSRMREGIRYRYVGAGRSHILSRATYVLAAVRLIMRKRYDIVIEDVSPFSPLFAARFSAGAPAVASVQNLSGRHALRKHGPLGLAPRLVETPLLRSFRFFVAVSEGIQSALAKRVPGARIKVIPNSASALFSATGGSEATSFEPYIMSLGRIDVYQKGLDRLLAAFDRVADDHPGLRLLVAGGGPDDQVKELRALVAGSAHAARVTILGAVPPERAASLLQRASLLVMPSRFEAWPLTAVEAGAAGTPVVGSDIVGVRDAAPPFPVGHGVLTADGDVDALAAAISTVIDSPEFRQQLADRGRAWAGRFTWDALAQSQLDFYEEIVAGVWA